jgi:iron-sulfur cluster insertion protein
MLHLTNSALEKLRDLKIAEGQPDLMLRIAVSGGGCQGFQYSFSFEEEMQDDDSKFEEDGVVVLVDPISFQYLNEATVDYTESLMESHFVINNPNVVSTCGCGSSFSL